MRTYVLLGMSNKLYYFIIPYFKHGIFLNLSQNGSHSRTRDFFIHLTQIHNFFTPLQWSKILAYMRRFKALNFLSLVSIHAVFKHVLEWLSEPYRGLPFTELHLPFTGQGLDKQPPMWYSILVKDDGPPFPGAPVGGLYQKYEHMFA